MTHKNPVLCPTGRIGFTAMEVAAALGTHPGHVRRLMRNGDLPAVKIGDRWYMPASELEALFGGKA